MPKKKFAITYLIKVRDVVEGGDKEMALDIFRSMYPETLDKEAKLIDIQEIE